MNVSTPSCIDETALFPIGTISEQTGVNTVTLRAWERRYGLLKPHRTPKGHRLYSQQDVQRVKQVLVLLEQGIPVSRVREVLDNNKTLPNLLVPATTVQNDDPWLHYRQQFQRWLRKLDTRSLEHTFNEAVSLYSLELVAKKLVLPLYRHQQQQSQCLPSTQADFAFLHEFLAAKLSARYLQHNARATGKRVLLLNTQGYTAQIDTLLLANVLSQHGYAISLLGSTVTLDQLTLLMGRTELDGVLLVGNNYAPATLHSLVIFCQLPTFIYGVTETDLTHNTETLPLYALPTESADILTLLDATLGVTEA
jgi:DNA-binding transcriptional MerR regulator